MAESDDREFLRKVAEAYPRVGPTDESAKTRVLALVRGEPGQMRAKGASWWEKARDLGWPAPALAAALLVIGSGLGWSLRSRWEQGTGSVATGGSDLSNLPITSEVRLVQFVITAPGASRVAVVGDFNDWDPAAAPMQQRAGGSWTAAIPLPPGRHVYAFVVDGDHWLPDPSAPLAPEDGFGSRNSVIVIGGLEST